MSVCAKFQLSSWSRSGWKVCAWVGWGGVGNTWLLCLTPTLVALELSWVELRWVLTINFPFSVIIFVGYSLIVTMNTYAGDPIDCVHNKNEDWGDYLDSYCFIHGTQSLRYNLSSGTDTAAGLMGCKNENGAEIWDTLWTPSRHLSDTIKTPSRHHQDTFQTPTFSPFSKQTL